MTSGNGLYVLLVEDNDDDVVVMQENFERSGLIHASSVLGDGEAAIAYLRREGPYAGSPRPDLVMLDLGLPKADGFQVLDAMRQCPELREIPVVVFTQSRKDEDVIRSYDLGACSFVSKPVGVERFQELVRGFSIYWDALEKLERD